MSSYSNHLSQEIERMKHEMTATLPKEMASAANLMVHPAAGAMALSALGFGLAGQAVGTWLGAMSAAAEASHRFWQPLLDEQPMGAPVQEAAVPTIEAAREKTSAREAPAQAAIPRRAVAARPARQAATIVPREAAPFAASAETGPRKPAAIERPTNPDDLKAISGIGPKLEQVLNAQGIWTYAQIIAWGEPEIAWIEDLLGFGGRVARDNWLGQAATLAEAAR